ncbi:PD-(D/E)XK nuclease family protein, partial [Treponema succinifaciens]|uniref:PD-(D/E)XK nuclease family protein n=1 Tax=Treponema succinifaciens TaxID=167 RepID=UPI0023F20949
EDSLDVDLIKNYEAGVLIHKIIELVCKNFQDKNGIYKGKIPIFNEETSGHIEQLIFSAFDEAKLHAGFSRSPLALKIIESQKGLICKNVFLFFKQFCALPDYSSKKENKSFGGYFIEGVELEKEVPCSSNQFDFFGKIDCVLLNPDEPDELFIIDYKTGSAPSIKDCIFNADSIPVLGDFQMASYVKLLESNETKVCSAMFYKIKKDSADNFDVVQIISKTPNARSHNIDREGFEKTLSEFEIFAEYFYEKSSGFDFEPKNFQADKEHGINVYKDCMKCGLNSICRTSFNIAKKEIL